MDGNSSSTPSPVVFTTLPPWLATVGSTAVRCPRRTRAVPPHRRPLADCSRRHRRPGSARASARSRALPECHRAAPPAPFYTDHRTGCRARGRPKGRQVEPSDCGKSKFWLVKCAGRGNSGSVGQATYVALLTVRAISACAFSPRRSRSRTSAR